MLALRKRFMYIYFAIMLVQFFATVEHIVNSLYFLSLNFTNLFDANSLQPKCTSAQQYSIWQ